MLSDLWDWFWSVANQWQVLVTGGFVTAALVLYQSKSGITLPWSVTRWIFLVFLVIAFFLAWRDQKDSARKAQSEVDRLSTVRPYVQIEELSADQIHAKALANSKNKIRPDAAYERAYVFAESPVLEMVLYNYRNTSKTIPAKNIRHYRSVVRVDENGIQTVLPSNQSENYIGLLFPEQYNGYSVTMPKGTLLTGKPGPQGYLKITLVLTYRGQDSDKNTYYYKIVLKALRQPDMDTLNRSFGGLKAEFADEGIVKDLQQLLQ